MFKPILSFFLFTFFLSTSLLAQKKVLFFQTDWGNKLSLDEFLQRTKSDGYDGIEVWFPQSEDAQQKLKEGLAKYDLQVIFLHGTNKGESSEEALKEYEEGLRKVMAWKPVKVNSHTGSDLWTQEENQRFIEMATKLSKELDVPVVHETHRGRFSFNLVSTQSIVQSSPDLRLNLDVSHWMVVHERLLKLNEPLLKTILPRVDHIHARVGYSEGPQVNDPSAPEWANELKVHLDIWEAIIQNHPEDTFTITTEFGPPPYLPTVPFTNVPISDQWAANVFIMKAIKNRLAND